MYKESSKHYKVSFVVDRLASHYYQAELLLYSLEQFSYIPKEDILVQCLNHVDKEFFDFLESQDYNYNIIEPYLDGKYCNKLQQLEAFKDKENIDGVILLDTDMFILEPFDILDNDNFYGKIVDGPNPPMETLKNIFTESNLKFPEIIKTDFEKINNQTFDCYFNGGFYFIPQFYISKILDEWKRWAEWLYKRENLFKTKQQFIHVDQISMSMAIVSMAIPYQMLPSNSNCAIHRDSEQKYFSKEKKIILLHYHQEISPFGLLNTRHASNDKILKAIEKANEAIVKKGKFQFFELWKRSLISKVALKDTHKLEKFENDVKLLVDLVPANIKIIFHAGTPKTGTTTIQYFLNENYHELLKLGILYPRHKITSPVPKHQWIVTHLKNKQYELFYENLKDSLEEIDEHTHTIIFSTEGIYNHWNDFSSESKEVFALLNKYFDVSLWIWFREPHSFARSYYRQNLKNPRVQDTECYGNDLSFEEMLEDEWFNVHFDYLGFLIEIEAIFDRTKIKVFSFGGDIIHQINSELDIPNDLPFSEDKNIGMHAVSEEILRIVNRYPLSASEKENAVDSVNKIDLLLSSYLEDTGKKEKSESLQMLLSNQLPILEKRYSLVWKDNTNKQKQLIIAGFHRSGTSMLAQEFHRAGLFLGDHLAAGNIANEDGFFEDEKFFHLHANILRYHKTDWQYGGSEALSVPPSYQEEMKNLIDIRNLEYSEWGFKDPRSALFLSEWYQQLSNPYTVIIYRHYSETSRSLLHRASRNILFRPNAVPLRFWREKELAYRMWLSYNRALIKHIKAHPDSTIVISHDAIVNGYPIAKNISEKFGFTLDDNISSGIKTSLLSDHAIDVPLPDSSLKKELDYVWSELQRLSIVPAKEKSNSIQHTLDSNIKISEIQNSIQSILQDSSVTSLLSEPDTSKVQLQYQWILNVITYLGKNDYAVYVEETLLSIDDIQMKNDFKNRIFLHLKTIEKNLKKEEGK